MENPGSLYPTKVVFEKILLKLNLKHTKVVKIVPTGSLYSYHQMFV